MSAPPRTRLSDPCPCGSGKKYRDCCAARQNARRRLWRRTRKVLAWSGAIAVVAALVYGLSLTSGVAYSEADIAVVDFSGLTPRQKRTALQEANNARCVCGCGLGLAQCVATDSTCPVRTGNIERIRTMVRQASQSGS